MAAPQLASAACPPPPTTHEGPVATHLARTTSLVGRQTQAIEEGDERQQREAVQQDEVHRERFTLG